MTLRKITVEDTIFRFKCTNGFGDNTEIATFRITIFLDGYKQTPLIIDFVTWEDLYAGNPLKTGVKLMNLGTNEEEFVNLNRPKYIRECILYGIKMGWTGENRIEPIDGLKMLISLDYDVSYLYPKEGFIRVHGKEHLK